MEEQGNFFEMHKNELSMNSSLNIWSIMEIPILFAFTSNILLPKNKKLKLSKLLMDLFSCSESLIP